MAQTRGKSCKFGEIAAWKGVHGAGVLGGIYHLSGPVLRDTARLSQRYPPIARYGVFGVSTWPIGCDTPLPLSEPFHPWRACEVEVRYPPLKRGISAILARYPMKTRQNCAIWGGILHWAAKSTTGALTDIFLPNYFQGLVRAPHASSGKGAPAGKGLLPK